MGFIAELRTLGALWLGARRLESASRHYNAGTTILMNSYPPPLPHPSLSTIKPSEEAIKHLQRAIKHLQKAVKLNPSFTHAYHNLAHAWYRTAEYNIAVASYKGFTQEVEDRITDALESALEAADQVLTIRHDFPEAHNTRAMVLAKLFRLDEALEATGVALAQYPGYENARVNREKIEEMIRDRGKTPGYKNESDFLEKLEEAKRMRAAFWKDLGN